jgi:hypothetical protein
MAMRDRALVPMTGDGNVSAQKEFAFFYGAIASRRALTVPTTARRHWPRPAFSPQVAAFSFRRNPGVSHETA